MKNHLRIYALERRGKERRERKKETNILVNHTQATYCTHALFNNSFTSLEIPYSGNLSREKTFANFAVFEYPRNFWGGYRSGFS